ncbi:hypothetical protein [Noviherbaspirillum sedimenti]|uniref:hypothetical protein n=1 Tax=Noviherbaspirillum sedimenti TaxID=2320865 RepID=UPI0011C3F69E|nr:hypothetical protein [Noviherbaspirillum sedimenti]
MMKRLRFVLISLMLVGVGTCDIAAARPGHHNHYHGHGRVHAHVGVYVGPAIGWNWYQPAPYAYSPYTYSPYTYSPYTYSPYTYSPYTYSPYSYSPYYYPHSPTVVVVPPAPSAYIEHAPPDQGRQEQLAPNDWYYYCKKPEGYYPYVRRCPGGWQRVPAQPPR